MWSKVFLILIFFCCAVHQLLRGQSEPEDLLTISLLTCDAGDDLYSIFGHSAIRIKNRATRQDLVFNYGTFDFDEPGFMYKFLKGRLKYKLALQSYSNFIQSYQRQKRSVTEQEVHLTPTQEKAVENFLIDNYRPENRYYLYDFFHDNCATRIRDVFEDQSKAQLLIPENRSRGLSYRQGLDQFDQHWPWTDFGMDLILGLNADKQMHLREEMYLPEYLADNLNEYILNHDGQAVEFMGPPKSILTFDKGNSKPWPWPLIVFSVLFLSILLLQLFVRSSTLHKTIDTALFLILGLMGVQMTFMWLGTDHLACKNNLNILWANPLYLLLLYPIIKSINLKWPFIFILLISVLLLAGWRLIPQEFHPAVMPILGIVVLRCMYNLKNDRTLSF